MHFLPTSYWAQHKEIEEKVKERWSAEKEWCKEYSISASDGKLSKKEDIGDVEGWQAEPWLEEWNLDALWRLLGASLYINWK